MRLICVVEDVFQPSGRGCVILPGLSMGSPRDFVLHIGDAVRVRKPCGGEFDTIIRGIELLGRARSPPTCIPLLLDAGVKKADIPIGSELWLVASKS